MQSQVEDRLDRLDDVIHVLRNHAVGPTAAGLPDHLQGLANQSQQGHPEAASGLQLSLHPPAMVSAHSSGVFRGGAEGTSVLRVCTVDVRACIKFQEFSKPSGRRVFVVLMSSLK